MKLLFYKLPTVTETKASGLHWFYAKKNQSDDCLETINLKEQIEKGEKVEVDYNKPLEMSEISKNIVDLYHLGHFSFWSMYYSTYFYDPINGYCHCKSLYEKLSTQSLNYLNQLRLKWDTHPRKLVTTHCQCFDDIYYGGNNCLTVGFIESTIRLKKYSPFKEGFNSVLYVKEVDIFNIGSRTHYLVCSLNVMNVKQVQTGVFEIGLSYEFIQDWHLFMMLSNVKKAIYPKTLSYFSDLSNFSKNFFFEDQKIYYDHCIFLIKNWISKGFLPANELYNFVFLEKTNYRFNEGNRFYLKRSDFDLILSNKKQENKKKQKSKVITD